MLPALCLISLFFAILRHSWREPRDCTDFPPGTIFILCARFLRNIGFLLYDNSCSPLFYFVQPCFSALYVCLSVRPRNVWIKASKCFRIACRPIPRLSPCSLWLYFHLDVSLSIRILTPSIKVYLNLSYLVVSLIALRVPAFTFLGERDKMMTPLGSPPIHLCPLLSDFKTRSPHSRSCDILEGTSHALSVFSLESKAYRWHASLRESAPLSVAARLAFRSKGSGSPPPSGYL